MCICIVCSSVFHSHREWCDDVVFHFKYTIHIHSECMYRTVWSVYLFWICVKYIFLSPTPFKVHSVNCECTSTAIATTKERKTNTHHTIQHTHEKTSCIVFLIRFIFYYRMMCSLWQYSIDILKKIHLFSVHHFIVIVSYRFVYFSFASLSSLFRRSKQNSVCVISFGFCCVNFYMNIARVVWPNLLWNFTKLFVNCIVLVSIFALWHQLLETNKSVLIRFHPIILEQRFSFVLNSSSSSSSSSQSWRLCPKYRCSTLAWSKHNRNRHFPDWNR